MKALISHRQVLCTSWAAAVLFGVVSPMGAITIDFESFTGMASDRGTPVPESARLSDQFRSTHGVVFRSYSPYVAVVNLGAGRASSGVNGIAGVSENGILSYGVQDPIAARFVDPQNPATKAVTDFVSVRIIPRSSNFVATFIAANANGDFIGYRQISDTNELTLQFSIVGIHSVSVSCGNAAVDDFVFNPVRPIEALFESARLGPVGQTDGLELQFGETFGVQFHLNKAVHVTGIGAHLGAADGAIPVARLIRLSNAAGLPAGGDFEMIANSARQVAPGPSQEYFFELHAFNLSAGHYAVVIGLSHRPNLPDTDYSGRPILFPGVDPEIRGTSYVVGGNTQWERFDSRGRRTGFRFVLYGVPLD